MQTTENMVFHYFLIKTYYMYLSILTPLMIPIENNTESDDIAWAERAQYWEKEANPSHSKKETAKHRVKEATQLILTYHVVQLCIDHGAILVCKGFTHYPQKRQEWRLFPSYKKIPSRIILLDIDGSLSSDMVK